MQSHHAFDDGGALQLEIARRLAEREGRRQIPIRTGAANGQRVDLRADALAGEIQKRNSQIRTILEIRLPARSPPEGAAGGSRALEWRSE